MTGLEVSRRAAAVKPGDNAAADDLAGQIVSEAREIPAALVGKLIATPKKDAVNGTYITVALEEQALDALLGRVEGCTAARRRQFLDWIVDHERRQRGRILARLETLFDDKSPVTGLTAQQSVASSNGNGAPPTPRRICDDAFLLARRLLAAPVEACDLAADEKFLKQPTDQRDRAIQKMLKSPRWAAFVVRE